jgi:hypothetical protein
VKSCRAAAVAARPLMVKLSPNVTSIARMAKVAAEAGAQAISLVNTFLALAIDVETRRPRIANVTGGLSGPAIKPIAVRMVYEAAQGGEIPVVGMGGIVRAEDAVEFMLAGATAVQVGTASYADPRAVENIAQWVAAVVLRPPGWACGRVDGRAPAVRRSFSAGGTARDASRAGLRTIRRALLSVTDKTGLVEFARAGGAWGRAGFDRRDGAGAARGGAGGARHQRPDRLSGDAGWAGEDAASQGAWRHSAHARECGASGVGEEHAIEPIDMVVVNLYAFEKTANKPGRGVLGHDREHRHRRAVDGALGGEEL